MLIKSILSSNNSLTPYKGAGDMQRVASHEAEKLYLITELNALDNQLKTALAKQALDNVALLASAAQEHFRKAPAGVECYKKILDAYADNTAQMLKRSIYEGGKQNDGKSRNEYR